jgi:hypothetical protein
MGLQEQKIESLPFVTAELNYLAPTPGKPRTYAFDPPPGEPKSTALPEPRNVPIFDARPIAQNLSLDREGFALVRHPTIVKNFYDDQEVRKVYYPAGEAFLARHPERRRVFIFDHTVRGAWKGRRCARRRRTAQPATTHPRRPDRYLRPQPRVRAFAGRSRRTREGTGAGINLWRPIRGPVLDAPLAMADGGRSRRTISWPRT